jgi:hypothetical protein
MRSALAGVVLAVVLAPREADACSLCDKTGSVSLASDDALQPANAGVFVWGVASPAGHVEARVDGEIAELEVIDGIGLTDLYGDAIAARVVPTPPPGATIEVLGSPDRICFGETLPDEQSFVAGAIDTTPPADLVDPYWDLLEVDIFDMAGCTPRMAGLLYLHGELSAEDAGQAARVLEIEVSAANQSILHRRTRLDVDTAIRVEIVDEALGEAPADELCVRVTVVDVAGNRGEPSEWMCRPCHAVVVTETTDSFPDEPQWTPQTLVRGGYCGAAAPPDTTSGTSADESTDGADTMSAGDETTGSPTITTDAPTTAADETSGAPRADGGAVDRGCACALDSRGFPFWLFIAFAGLRRRGALRRSYQRLRSSASSRTQGASGG